MLPCVAAGFRERMARRIGRPLTGAERAQLMELADYRKMNTIRTRVDRLVKDPATAAALKPWYRQFCKRPCFHDEYLDTFNRPNVTLVDLSRSPIREFTRTGLRTDGAEYALDAVVFATGFDAMTGALLRIDLRGRGGLPLSEKWAAGPRTYLGLAIAGFPNLFTVSGPGSPSVLTNMVVSIEQHVDWIADCIAHLRAQGKGTIDLLLNDPETREQFKTLVDNLSGSSADLKTIIADVKNGQGTIGKLMQDDGLYEEAKKAVAVLTRSLEDYREAAPITAFTSVLFAAF